MSTPKTRPRATPKRAKRAHAPANAPPVPADPHWPFPRTLLPGTPLLTLPFNPDNFEDSPL